MTTNPVLTMTPQALQRRALIRFAWRARALLHDTYRRYEAGSATQDDVLFAMQRVYRVANKLDQLDDAVMLDEA